MSVVEWVRQGLDSPVLIKFGSYKPRIHPDYEGERWWWLIIYGHLDYWNTFSVDWSLVDLKVYNKRRPTQPYIQPPAPSKRERDVKYQTQPHQEVTLLVPSPRSPSSHGSCSGLGFTFTQVVLRRFAETLSLYPWASNSGTNSHLTGKKGQKQERVYLDTDPGIVFVYTTIWFEWEYSSHHWNGAELSQEVSHDI